MARGHAERAVKRVAVIGAGWSGLACALELTRRGFAVTVYDAAPKVGGRARAVSVRLGDRDFELDNGQHLLIGAYSETLRVMAQAGVDRERTLLRLPFHICYPDRWSLRASRLPAPWHLATALLTARGLSWDARRHTATFVRRWQRHDWRLADDATADTLFADAPPDIVRRLWRPLCLAALNVEPAQASARVLLAVLRDALAGAAAASDLLVPRSDLTRAFAAPAQQLLQRRGAELRLRSPVQRLSTDAGGWRIDGRDSHSFADAVVLALPPRRAAALLGSVQCAELASTVAVLTSIAMAPIATVYLRFPTRVRLPGPVLALLDDRSVERYGQWVFDRGQLDPAHAGVLGVVISAADQAPAGGPASLAAAVAAQLTADLGLPAPLASAVLTEKRATIVPRPGLQRPPTRLPPGALYLAGDSAASEYPSTLEGSVRAGVAAAAAASADLGLP